MLKTTTKIFSFLSFHQNNRIKQIRSANRRKTTRSRLVEQLEQRQLLAGDCVLIHNADQPADVNGDSHVSPIDALLTINYLIDVGNAPEGETPCPRGDHAYDVNNDGEVSPVDAVNVINRLIERNDDLRAEPEAGDIELKIGDETSVIYNSESGEISFESAVDLRVIQMISESGIFAPAAAINLDGDFDIARPHEMTKISIDKPFFRTISLGNIAPTGLTAEFLSDDLKIEGAPSTGGILTNDWLNIGVEFRNEFGHPLESVKVGETFQVALTVEDHRPGPISLDTAGVFAAFTDVTFDPSLAIIDGGLRFSDTYDLAPSGEVGFGFIDEVGAAASEQEPLGREVRDLVNWTMNAISGGSFGLELGLADNLPFTDTLLYGLDDPVDPSLIEFDDDATIEIIGDISQTDLIRIEIADDKFVVYDPWTGELSTESLADDIRVLQMKSASEIFIPDAAINLDGDFDVRRTDEITKVVPFPPYWGILSFGNVLPPGLTEEFLAEDLTIEGAPNVGGTLTADLDDVGVSV